MELGALTLALKKGPPKESLLVLWGPERALLDRALEAIRASHPDFQENFLRYGSAETDWPALRNELATPPFLASRKLVAVIDEGNFIHNHREEIAAWLKNPSPSALLVLVTAHDKAPALPSHESLALVAARPPRGADRLRWIHAEFTRRGREAEAAAATLLAESTDLSMAEMEQEIEKIGLYVGASRAVSADDVRAVHRRSVDRNAFDLARRVVRGDARAALTALEEILEGGENIPRILSAIGWQYRKLIEARRRVDAGRPAIDALAHLQIKSFTDEFLVLLRERTAEELIEGHARIVETDAALKSSGGQDRLRMEILVARLCRKRGAPAGAR